MYITEQIHWMFSEFSDAYYDEAGSHAKDMAACITYLIGA